MTRTVIPAALVAVALATPLSAQLVEVKIQDNNQHKGPSIFIGPQTV